jgi:glycosyltransferase involved in cell wall biosynthesis
MRDLRDLRGLLSSAGWSSRADEYLRMLVRADCKVPAQTPRASVVVVSCVASFTAIQVCRFLSFQTSNDVELIFVDNGCAPGTVDAIQPFANIVVSLAGNTGACTGRNIGALYSRAPLVIFLDDDAIPAPDLVACFLAEFRRYRVVSIRGRVVGKSANPLNELATHYDLGPVPCPFLVNTEGVSAYDRRVFLDVGGWDDELVYGHEGIDLSIRLLEATNEMASQIYSPAPLILHDFARDEASLDRKRERQALAADKLTKRHPGWREYRKSWNALRGRVDLLRER